MAAAVSTQKKMRVSEMECENEGIFERLERIVMKTNGTQSTTKMHYNRSISEAIRKAKDKARMEMNLLFGSFF